MSFARSVQWGIGLAGGVFVLLASGAVAQSGALKSGGRTAAVQEEHQNTREALARVLTELEGAEARIVVRGRAYVKRARAGLLPIAGGVEELIDHASSLERLRRALKRDQDLHKRLLERRLELVRDLVKTREGPDDGGDKRAAVTAPHAAVLAEQDRSLAFDKAFNRVSQRSRQARKAPTESGLYVPPASASGESTLKFADKRGRLPLPVSGRARVHRTESSGAYIAARGGSPVRAVHRGRVVFAGPYQARGQAVIVDHGDGFSSLSAGLGDIRVAVGESVPRGTQLGTLGGKGSRQLYFEVRKGEAPVPTAPWFGL